ncbi:hypothetical protein [Roseateles sp. LKC17W]|uniref:Uncharacterized protein n=1 Tax=Pelomonas margarita TaxID=3299031 RepID=A0ABW7FPM6_9BURK
MPPPASAIQHHIAQIFEELLRHDGYGEFKVELRILKRGQKEVLVHYGKQYRYVIDFPASAELTPGVATSKSSLMPAAPA